MFVESFALHEPYWTLRTGSVPFWKTFNMQPSLDWVHQYLDSMNAYDEIYMRLFSHGTDSVGLASIAQWKIALNRTKK